MLDQYRFNLSKCYILDGNSYIFFASYFELGINSRTPAAVKIAAADKYLLEQE